MTRMRSWMGATSSFGGPLAHYNLAVELYAASVRARHQEVRPPAGETVRSFAVITTSCARHSTTAWP